MFEQDTNDDNNLNELLEQLNTLISKKNISNQINKISSLINVAKVNINTSYEQYKLAKENLSAAILEFQMVFSSENTIIKQIINIDNIAKLIDIIKIKNQSNLRSIDELNKNDSVQDKKSKKRYIEVYNDNTCQHCDRDNQPRRKTRKGNVQCIDEDNCWNHIERVRCH